MVRYLSSAIVLGTFFRHFCPYLTPRLLPLPALLTLPLALPLPLCLPLLRFPPRPFLLFLFKPPSRGDMERKLIRKSTHSRGDF